jgi:hypothetical protein
MALIPLRTGKSEGMLKTTFQMMQNMPEASLEISANHSEFNVPKEIVDRVKVNGVSGTRTISFPSGPEINKRMVDNLPDKDELDFIWMDESNFVPLDTWMKMIIPLDK